MASMSLKECFTKVLKHHHLLKPKSNPFGSVIGRSSRIWVPNYLVLGETKTPEFDLINVQIKGYDFAILENYQKLVKRIARMMKINVVKSWATPAQDLHIQHFKPNSSQVKYDYYMKEYERNVQILDVKSTIMQIFIEVLITACPPGVKISLHNHENSMEEIRYVPNLEILELQEELESIGAVVKKKKKSG